MPRRMRAVVPLLLATAACPGGGGGGVSPPAISAVVVSFPGGGAPPGFEGGAVEVLDGTTGEPLQDASVTVNGAALAYVPAQGDYEGSFTVAPGAAVDLRVTVRGRTYAASATSFSAAPTIDAPAAGAVWASGCDNAISWSGGAPLAGTAPLVAVLDANDPNAMPLVGFGLLPESTTTTTVPANALTAGSRLVFVGLSLETAIPTALAGSSLALVGARTAPVTVVSAAYRALSIFPPNRGLGSGQTLPLQARAPLCDGIGMLDLTAAATWSSSDASVVSVSNDAGSVGLASGVAPGTATISAEVQGIGGSTVMAVRDFTPQGSPATGKLLGGVAWSGSQLVAVGESGTILTSPDGTTWTPQVSGTGAELTGVGVSPSRMVAVQYGSSAVLTSPDGVTWTPGSAGSGEGFWSVVWTGDRFVAVGIGGTISTSPDGLSWTPQTSGTTGTLAGVASSGTRIVAVGGAGSVAGVILTSSDGVSWTPTAPPSAGLFDAVTFTGTQFLAFGDGGVLASPDGVAWTAQPRPEGFILAAAASSTEVMAVGDFGAIATSADGRTWITWTVGSNRLTGVAWTGNRWVVVGGLGTILTSP